MIKNCLKLFLTGLLFFYNLSTQAQFVEIPDSNFRNWLHANYPACMNNI